MLSNDTSCHIAAQQSMASCTMRSQFAPMMLFAAARLDAEQLEAFRERAHEGDPVRHEEEVEADLQRHVDEVLELVARHELDGQLPRRLQDGEDDEQARAVRQDVLRARRDDVFGVVVHEAA